MLFTVALIIFAAAMTQSIAGFGFALMAMPPLVSLVGIQEAAPLVALSAAVNISVLVFRYRQKLILKPIGELALGSLVGIPVGVLALRQLDEDLVTGLLGAFLVGYALYGLIAPGLPVISAPAWGYGFGFMGGLLTGAYNTGGPPLVIYGTCRRWEPDVFKGNVQSLLLLHSLTVTVTHFANNNITANILQNFALASIPAMILGSFAGLYVDRYINPHLFHRLILIMLLLMGAHLLQAAL